MIMMGIGYVLLLIAGIIDLILVVKIFKQEGLMKGILAFFCFIYAYIWGWQHAKSQNLGKMMWAYTICFILGMILYYAGAGSIAMSTGGGGTDLPTAVPTEGLLIIRTLLHV